MTRQSARMGRASRLPPMPEASWIRRLVPRELRERVFDPAVVDARLERAARRRHAHHPLSRASVDALFVTRVLSAALACRTIPTPRRPLMIRHDLTFALRMLRKAPGFTLAAVLATALGIGANTAIFTVIKQVLLQPLPFPEPSRIVDVNEYRLGAPFAVSAPNFIDWRAGNQTLSALSTYNQQVLTLTSAETEPSRISATLIDDALVEVTGVPPLLGRAFTGDDMRPGGRKVVIVGYNLWQRAFGGDRGIVSRAIDLEGEPYEVVGVMPRGFEFPDESDAWLPLRFTPAALGDNQR